MVAVTQSQRSDCGVSRAEDAVAQAGRKGGMLVQFRAERTDDENVEAGTASEDARPAETASKHIMKASKTDLAPGTSSKDARSAKAAPKHVMKALQTDPTPVDPALKGKVDGIDKRLAALEQKVAAMPDLANSISAWEKKVEQYDSALTKRLDDTDTKLGQVSNTVTSLKSMNSTTQARLLAVEQKLVKCMGITMNLKSVNSTREARVVEVEEKLNDVMSKVVSLRSTNATQDARISSLESKANDLSETVVALQAVNNTRGVQLSAAEVELKRLDEKSLTIEETFGTQLQDLKTNTDSSLQTLGDRSTALETANGTVRGQLSDLKGGFDSHKADMATRMEALEADLQHKVLGLGQSSDVSVSDVKVEPAPMEDITIAQQSAETSGSAAVDGSDTQEQQAETQQQQQAETQQQQQEGQEQQQQEGQQQQQQGQQYEQKQEQQQEQQQEQGADQSYSAAVETNSEQADLQHKAVSLGQSSDVSMSDVSVSDESLESALNGIDR